VDWPDRLLSLQWRPLIDAAVSSAFDCANTRYPNEQGCVGSSGQSEVQAAPALTRVDPHCCVAHRPIAVATSQAV